MTDRAQGAEHHEHHELPDVPQQRDDSPYAALNNVRGAPTGARQHVRSDAGHDAVARPGGATQNSGGALASNDDEMGHGPGRGAD
jgi:hypothetical protein